MIRFGPAGIPLSCKGRTLKDGIEDVHNLSLTAMEIQMVRAGTFEAYPEDEDVGKTMNTMDDMMVVEIIRDDESICDPDMPIEEDDVMVVMNSGIVNSFGQLAPIGRMAKRLDVAVSLHTPYYMDMSSNADLTSIPQEHISNAFLTAEDEKKYGMEPLPDDYKRDIRQALLNARCENNIKHAALIVNALQGDLVVTSLGIYNDKTDEEEIDANIYDNIAEILDWWQDMKLTPKLGIEITGQQEVFGSMDQVLDMCDEFGDTIVPVVNFPHLHSRTMGSLLDVSDFTNVIEQVRPYSDGKLYANFAGVEHFQGNELRLTPIKKGDLKFETFAEALAEIKPDATIISSSPLLEHDAMYMRVMYERVVNKRVGKMLRAKRKEQEAAAGAVAGE